MSKIKRTWDISAMICPYCGHSYQPNGENITEDQYEIECDGCGKKYLGSHIILIYHEGSPDCELNDEKHIWKKDSKHKYYYCGVCGKIKNERRGQ